MSSSLITTNGKFNALLSTGHMVIQRVQCFRYGDSWMMSSGVRSITSVIVKCGDERKFDVPIAIKVEMGEFSFRWCLRSNDWS